MLWCYNCQRNIQSIENMKCEYCSCEAIEQITQENNPVNFQPYVPTTETQSQQNQENQRQQMNESIPFNPFGMGMFNMVTRLMMTEDGPISLRYVVHRPMVRIIIFDSEEQQKTPVSQEKVNNLQKVQLHQECAICQQKEGENGLKLPCKHEFHENCIKPWFENTNTCPCCRVAL